MGKGYKLLVPATLEGMDGMVTFRRVTMGTGTGVVCGYIFSARVRAEFLSSEVGGGCGISRSPIVDLRALALHNAPPNVSHDSGRRWHMSEPSKRLAGMGMSRKGTFDGF